MGLNASKVSGKQSNYEPMEAGTYPARLVAVIDLGLQAQPDYQGKPKELVNKISLTYEFLDEFMKDEDGQPQPDKPRWLSEDFPFYNLDQDKANSTKRYKALDVAMVHDGDWTKLIGTPCLVTVVLNPAKDGSGRVYENIGAVQIMRQKDAANAGPLVNEPITFDLDAPDLELWKRIPPFIQKKIKGNLKYAGSVLDKLLGPDAAPPKQAPAASTAPTKGKPSLKVVANTDTDEAPPY